MPITDDQAYKLGIRHAQNSLSQIGNYKKAAEVCSERLGDRDFEAEIELHHLLHNTKSAEERLAILHAYIGGLEKIDNEDKITLRPVWEKSFSRSLAWLFPCISNGILILSTRHHGEQVKEKNKIFAVDIKDGTERWSHTLGRKNIGAYRQCFDGHRLFYLPQYLGESDEYKTPPPFALDLETGRFLWTYNVIKDSEEEIQDICGVFQNSLIASDYSRLVAIDADSGRVKWRIRSHVRGNRQIFIPQNDCLILQTGDKEISWISVEGEVLARCELPFPIEGTGFINRVLANDLESDFYVSVYGRDWEKGEGERAGLSVIYAISKHNKKVRQLAEITGRLYQKLVSAGDLLYLCGERYSSDVVNRRVNKPSSPSKPNDFTVWAENDGLLLCPSTLNPILETPILVVRNSKDQKILWRRDNFKPLAYSRRFIFGLEVASSDQLEPPTQKLIVLDQKTGKEMSSHVLMNSRDSALFVTLIDDEHILILQDNRGGLFEIK